MTIDIVACRPVAHHTIGDRVETRHMECTNKEMPIVGIEWCEHIVILAHNEGVESCQHEEHHQGKGAFLSFHTKERGEYAHKGVVLNIHSVFLYLIIYNCFSIYLIFSRRTSPTGS